MKKRLKIFAIASGKGGVGKSNVAVNLATSLAQSDKNVLLADADLGLANLDILLGLNSKKNIADVISGQSQLKDILIRYQDKLDLLPASSGVLQLERLTLDQRQVLIKDIKEIAENYDYLIIDTGAGLTANVLLFSAIADTVLLVTRPEPTAITDAYALVKVLVKNYQVDHISLLVNQVSTATQGYEVHERLSSVCERFLDTDLGYLGSIPHDHAVERAVNAQTPLIHFEPKSRAASAFGSIAQKADELELSTSQEDRWKRLLTVNNFAKINDIAGEES